MDKNKQTSKPRAIKRYPFVRTSPTACAPIPIRSTIPGTMYALTYDGKEPVTVRSINSDCNYIEIPTGIKLPVYNLYSFTPHDLDSVGIEVSLFYDDEKNEFSFGSMVNRSNRDFTIKPGTNVAIVTHSDDARIEFFECSEEDFIPEIEKLKRLDLTDLIKEFSDSDIRLLSARIDALKADSSSSAGGTSSPASGPTTTKPRLSDYFGVNSGAAPQMRDDSQNKFANANAPANPFEQFSRASFTGEIEIMNRVRAMIGDELAAHTEESFEVIVRDVVDSMGFSGEWKKNVLEKISTSEETANRMDFAILFTIVIGSMSERLGHLGFIPDIADFRNREFTRTYIRAIVTGIEALSFIHLEPDAIIPSELAAGHLRHAMEVLIEFIDEMINTNITRAEDGKTEDEIIKSCLTKTATTSKHMDNLSLSCSLIFLPLFASLTYLVCGSMKSCIFGTLPLFYSAADTLVEEYRLHGPSEKVDFWLKKALDFQLPFECVSFSHRLYVDAVVDHIKKRLGDTN
jgi:hypothetical protein